MWFDQTGLPWAMPSSQYAHPRIPQRSIPACACSKGQMFPKAAALPDHLKFSVHLGSMRKNFVVN